MTELDKLRADYTYAWLTIDPADELIKALEAENQTLRGIIRRYREDWLPHPPKAIWTRFLGKREAEPMTTDEVAFFQQEAGK